jgi:hypothetical protein
MYETALKKRVPNSSPILQTGSAGPSSCNRQVRLWCLGGAVPVRQNSGHCMCSACMCWTGQTLLQTEPVEEEQFTVFEYKEEEEEEELAVHRTPV